MEDEKDLRNVALDILEIHRHIDLHLGTLRRLQNQCCPKAIESLEVADRAIMEAGGAIMAEVLSVASEPQS